MKTIRTLLFIVFFIGIVPEIRSQITLIANSRDYIALDSYLGVETPEDFNRLQFGYQGEGVYLPNWSVTFRLLQPIMPSSGRNVSGQPFPPEKISFRFTMDDNQEINLNSIGANRNPIYLKPSEPTYMIQKARYPMQVTGGAYKRANLNFTFKVDGGKYLDDYKNQDIYSPIEYRIPLQFTLYDEQGRVLSSSDKTLTLSISPNLRDGHLVDVEPDYSISIQSEANNVTINFRTQQDYQEGVRLHIDDAIKVNAKGGFELRLKALSPALITPEGNTMELSTVGQQLLPGTGARNISRNPFVTLSADEQTILVGEGDGSKEPQYFHIDYKGVLTREQLRRVKTGAYSTSLMYLLLPR